MSEKSSLVHDLFAHIATRYDLANAVLSMGMHFLWNRKLVKLLKATPAHDYLDLCAGTGAIAAIYLKAYHPTGRVVLLDFCEPMLEIARKRLTPKNFSARLSDVPSIEFIHGDALAVPQPDASFDRISLAYGLRNLTHPLQGLQESYRLLRPQGHLAILELTRPNHRVLNWMHRRWLQKIAGPVSGALSQSPAAYTYLHESIQSFSEPQQVIEQMKTVGFHSVVSLPLHGQIATIFVGEKP